MGYDEIIPASGVGWSDEPMRWDYDRPEPLKKKLAPGFYWARMKEHIGWEIVKGARQFNYASNPNGERVVLRLVKGAAFCDWEYPGSDEGVNECQFELLSESSICFEHHFRRGL